MRFSTLRERLYALIDNCDAALVLPGGIGTLAELAAMWSQLQTSAITPKRLILIGSGWQEVMQHFIDQFDGYVPEINRPLIEFAADVGAATEMLETKQTNI
jgi:predicted Rossmann-fold nucleotide-binding protein